MTNYKNIDEDLEFHRLLYYCILKKTRTLIWSKEGSFFVGTHLPLTLQIHPDPLHLIRECFAEKNFLGHSMVEQTFIVQTEEEIAL